MVFPWNVFFLSTEVFLYFFLQLSRVVDLNVSLNIWWLLNIESFFNVFSKLCFVDLQPNDCFIFFVCGTPVQQFDVTISKFSWFIIFLVFTLFVCCLLLLFIKFSLFLKATLFRISKGCFDCFVRVEIFSRVLFFYPYY